MSYNVQGSSSNDYPNDRVRMSREVSGLSDEEGEGDWDLHDEEDVLPTGGSSNAPISYNEFASESGIHHCSGDGKYLFKRYCDDMHLLAIVMQLKPFDQEHGWVAKSWVAVSRALNTNASGPACQKRLKLLMERYEQNELDSIRGMSGSAEDKAKRDSMIEDVHDMMRRTKEEKDESKRKVARQMQKLESKGVKVRNIAMMGRETVLSSDAVSVDGEVVQQGPGSSSRAVIDEVVEVKPEPAQFQNSSGRRPTSEIIDVDELERKKKKQRSDRRVNPGMDSVVDVAETLSGTVSKLDLALREKRKIAQDRAETEAKVRLEELAVRRKEVEVQDKLIAGMLDIMKAQGSAKGKE